MDNSLEAGIRPAEFWKWAVDREVRARIMRRRPNRLGPSFSMPELPPAGTGPEHEPVWDHGLVFMSLHDIHRQEVRASDALRLPPVEPPKPLPVQKSSNISNVSAWRWPGSSRDAGAAPAEDMDSALTAASTSCVTSALSSAVIPRAASRVTAGSLAPPVRLGSAIAPALPRSRSLSKASPSNLLADPIQEGQQWLGPGRKHRPRGRGTPVNGLHGQLTPARFASSQS
mmetsp:Transcript_27488/g.53773  ORF Transcript_27488/g.53773 Transcript_27488/m.53773 type:complete len:228 (-) Transcript_27488:84-767(-)